MGPLSALEVNDGAAASASAPTGAGASASALQAALAANPAVRAAAIFTTLLRADGVRVHGSPSTGKAPPGTPVLTTIASPPLAQEVDAMLTVSDDTAAELFTKEIGYQADGSGTTAAGVAAIRADLARDGLPVAQVVLYDGSGLDRNDRLTCGFLDADLQRLGAGSVVARGLPIAAKTGTLRGRLAGTPAAGRLRAKTGTLDDVSALSGFVLPRTGTAVPGTGARPAGHVLAHRQWRAERHHRTLYRRPGWRRPGQLPPPSRPRSHRAPTVTRRLPMFPLGTVLMPHAAVATARLRAALPGADAPLDRARGGARTGRGADRAGPGGRRRGPASRHGHPRPAGGAPAAPRWTVAGAADGHREGWRGPVAARRSIPSGRGRRPG